MISRLAERLEPYVPGEQLNDKRYIKLNTNESPYPPSPSVSAVIDLYGNNPGSLYENLRLYPDPEAVTLCNAIAKAHNVSPDMVLAGGGSDEILSYAFMAFFDSGDKVYYPDVTYGFYPVLAQMFGLNAFMPPLNDDFRVNIDDYIKADGHIVIANPNAPTGIALDSSDIEPVLAADKDRLFIVDEAYAAFSEGKSCVPLLKKYENLLVVHTYSKAYSLAGMRLGYALGAPSLINVLRRVKNSFNPYNLDRLSIEVGAAAILDKRYLDKTVKKIVKARKYTHKKLEGLGFCVLPSETNFLFLRRDGLEGVQLYQRLRDSGILARHFNKPRIRDFIRLSIGKPENMDQVIGVLERQEYGGRIYEEC
jgi:histidinol-phosphate aminotransferase